MFSVFDNFGGMASFPGVLPSFVYHRIRSLIQSVGAMLWSMAQLRRDPLRMVVYVHVALLLESESIALLRSSSVGSISSYEITGI